MIRNLGDLDLDLDLDLGPGFTTGTIPKNISRHIEDPVSFFREALEVCDSSIELDGNAHAALLRKVRQVEV